MTTRRSAAFVYLASASPRRRELLAGIGVQCEVVAAAVDEAVLPGEAAETYVCRLALAKVRAAGERQPVAPVVGADTAVVVDGQILGKPADGADARRMLALLSGRSHDVWSAVAVVSPAGESVLASRTEVLFRPISGQEAADYWHSGEPADKAGAYAIQGLGALFVREIRGSYSGVVGLPLFETAGLLARHGVDLLGSEKNPA
jgi:septum formation protein